MEAGRRFHDLAAAAGNERSPVVADLTDRLVPGCIPHMDTRPLNGR